MKKHLKRLVSLAMAACMMASLATVDGDSRPEDVFKAILTSLE